MRWLRTLIVFVIQLVIAFLIHLLMHGTFFTFAHISDALFVIGAIAFMLSLSLMVGAFQLFIGLGYVFRVTLSQSFRERYSTFQEYKEDKTDKEKNPLYVEVFIASVFIVLLAILFYGVAS